MSDSLRDQLLGLGFKPAPKPERNDKPSANVRPQHGHASKNDARRGDARRGDTSRGDTRNNDMRKDGARKGEPNKSGRPPHKPDDRKPQGHNAMNQPPRNAHAHKRPQRPQTQEEIDLAKAYAIRAQREKEERIEAERLKQEDARKRREAKAKLVELVKDKGLNDPNAEIARHFPYGGKIKRIYVNEAQLKQLNAGELGVVQLDGRYLLVTAALLDEAEAVFAPALALRVDPNATPEEDPYADPKYQVPDDLVW